MQFGITIPLQKQLKLSKPHYGDPVDLFFCWEIHRIKYQGRITLIIVNASNRYSIIMSGLHRTKWKNLKKIIEDAIETAWKAEGYSQEEIDGYFNLAGEAEITKTHGRKPVAGLNRVIEHLYLITEDMDKQREYQRRHCESINMDICSPAGFDDYKYPIEFLEEDMKRIGVSKIK